LSVFLRQVHGFARPLPAALPVELQICEGSQRASCAYQVTLADRFGAQLSRVDLV